MKKLVISLLIFGLFLPLSYAKNNSNKQTFRYTNKAENQVANYGYMDYFPEVSFKNNLKNQGYSQVYDFNDVNLDLTEVSYYGLKGNPNVIDKDYILTSEYEKYSSQYQDIRIDDNKSSIINNNNEIVRVEDESIQRDNIIKKSVNNNVINIANNQNSIKNNTRKINKINNKVNELEETQQIIGAKIRIYDSKNWQVNVFADYSVNRNTIDRTGVRIQYKIGKSYEERKIEELEKKLNQITK